MAQEYRENPKDFFSHDELNEMREKGKRGKKSYFEGKAREERNWSKTYERRYGGEKLTGYHSKRAEVYESMANQLEEQKKEREGEGGLVKKVAVGTIKGTLIGAAHVARAIISEAVEISKKQAKKAMAVILSFGAIFITLSFLSPRLNGNVILNQTENSSIFTISLTILILLIIFILFILLRKRKK